MPSGSELETNEDLSIEKSIATGSSWLSIVPQTLSDRNLSCQEQDSESAREIQKSGPFSDTEALKEIEEVLFDQLIEDDYDGALHLTTIRSEESEIIGIAFWREVPEDEMQDWIDLKKLNELSQEWQKKNKPRSIDQDDRGHNGRSPAGARKIRHLESAESLRWLSNFDESDRPKARASKALGKTSGYCDNVPEDYAQAWIKMELLAVRKKWWGRKIGSLLMACSLYHAYLHHDKRAILHVAGGRSNIPAVRLYEKFGFVSSPDGLFHKPNRDLYILGNIGMALQSIISPRLLQNAQDGKAIDEETNATRAIGD